MVADSTLVSSTSVMVSEEPMTVAPSPSEKARVPLAPEMTGGLFVISTLAVLLVDEK